MTHIVKCFSILLVCLASYLASYVISFHNHASVSSTEIDQYEQALTSFNQKDYETAYIHLKNSLQNNNEHVPSKILLGRVYLENNHYEEAELELFEALTLGGDIEFVLPYLGKSLLSQKKYEQVIQLGNKHRLSRLVKARWYLLRAQAYAGLKQDKLELANYQQAIKLAPDDVDTINALAIYYIRDKQLSKTQTLLTASFKLDEDNPVTWHLQGMIYKQQGKIALAATTFQKALEIEPELTDAIRSLASIYYNLDDSENALLTVEQVLKQAPEDSRAILLKAKLLLQNSDGELARQILDSLNNRLSLVSDQSLVENDWILYMKAISNFLLENYESAIREMTVYHTKNKDNFHAVTVIASSYMKLNLKGPANNILDEYREAVSQSLTFTVLLCDLYIDNNRQFKCETLLENINENFADSIEISLLKARLAYSREQFSVAITELENTKKKQQSPALDSYLINLYLANNQDIKAGQLIAKLLDEHPDNIELLNAMTAVLLKLGKPRRAYNVAQQILAKYPNHYQARYHQALVLLALKRPASAKVIVEKLVKEQSRNAKSLILLARIEAALGNTNESIHRLNQLLNFDNYNLSATHMLVQLLRLTGQYEQALVRLNQLNQKYRLETSVIQQKAEVYLLLGERKEAIKKLNSLFGFWHEDANNLLILSKLQIQAKDLKGARASIERAKTLAPKSSKVRYADIKLNIQEQDFKSADKQLARLNKSHKENSEVTELAADVALAKRQIDKAQSLYLEAFELNINNGMALVKAYNLALKGVQKESFELQLVKALDKLQSNFYYRNLLADFLLINQRYAEAKQHYLRIVKLKVLPNRADVLNNLAFATMQEDLDSALQFAQQANELKPNSAPLLDTLGWILANKNQYDQALTALRQAQSISARDPAIRYHLGFTLYKLDRTKEAIIELQYAINADNDFSEKIAAEQLLVLLRD